MADVRFAARSWVSFMRDGEHGYGIFDPTSGKLVDLREVTSAPELPETLLDLLRAGPQAWELAEQRAHAVFSLPGEDQSAGPLSIDDVQLTAPLPNPRLMLGIGGNYPAYTENYTHVPEAPRVFQKPVSAVIGPCDAVRLPEGISYVQPELELCVVVGRRMASVEPDAVADHLFGYTIGNDVTAVDPLMTDWVWRDRPEAAEHGLPSRTPLSFGLAFHSKAYDTFAPMGPGIVRNLAPDAGLEMSLEINGQTAQAGNTRDMLVPVGELLSWISHICTLEPGDIVWTGALPNLPALSEGDELTHTVEGIGSFQLTCRRGVFSKET